MCPARGQGIGVTGAGAWGGLGLGTAGAGPGQGLRPGAHTEPDLRDIMPPWSHTPGAGVRGENQCMRAKWDSHLLLIGIPPWRNTLHALAEWCHLILCLLS